MRPRVLDLLDQHGASFAVDLARLSGLEPSQARGALKDLHASRACDERPVRSRCERGPTRRLRHFQRPAGRGARVCHFVLAP